MKSEMTEGWGRRDFVRGLTLAGTAGLIGLRPKPAYADPPPETTTLRIPEFPITCVAPHYVAEELLYAEGFTDVRFLKFPSETPSWPPDDLLAGEVDITLSFPPTDITRIDAGKPIVILAGSHIGCVEVFASVRVRSITDLKGKTVGIFGRGLDDHMFISMFAAYVGLDPQKDIDWVVYPFGERSDDRIRLLTEGKIDAFFTGPPFSIELRDKKIGHIVLNTTTDPPWSQYFCCLIASTKEFVGQNPIATRRALRALLKAVDLCAADPQRVARLIADKRLSSYDYATRYEYALRSLQELPYKWREYDPEDTLRFYALRMRDTGLIKSSPQKIIADGTDWRFLNELKRELKA